MTAPSTTPAAYAALTRVNSPQRFSRGFVPAVRDVVRYRELLVNLVRKELKVRYKESTLGFVWSLVRPTALLAIYYLVFGLFLRSAVPYFAFYLFSGLVAWDLFGNVASGAATSIVGNAGLVKKVWFPREVLVLAVVGAAVFHFALQLVVLFVAMAVFRYDFLTADLAHLPLAFAALVVFMTAVGLLLAAANVYLRDVQHLLEVVLLSWFWTLPVVYPIHFALDALPANVVRLYLLNPMANVVIGFQKALYHGQVDVDPRVEVTNLADVVYGGNVAARLVAVLVCSSALLWLAQRIFARAEGNFAQEL